MYREYWNMEFDPFSKEIHIKKLFKTDDFNEAITRSRLKFLNKTKGIELFIGNPGSGKTYVVKYFLESLNSGLYKYDFKGITEVDTKTYITDRLNLVNDNNNIFKYSSIVALANACNGSLIKCNYRKSINYCF